MSAYMISSVIARRTKRSPSMPSYREKSSGVPKRMPTRPILGITLAGRLHLVGVDHRDGDDRHLGLEGEPGDARLALVEPAVGRAGALGVDAEQLARAEDRRPVRAPPRLARPPERSMGTWPTPRKNAAVSRPLMPRAGEVLGLGRGR